MSSRWISISFSGRAAFALRIDGGMHGLDQRRLAHAARAPQEHVVGGEAGGEALGVVDQDVAHAVDAADQPDIDAIDAVNRFKQAGIGSPDEAVGCVEIRRRRLARRQPRYGLDQPVELLFEGFRSAFWASIQMRPGRML